MANNQLLSEETLGTALVFESRRDNVKVVALLLAQSKAIPRSDLTEALWYAISEGYVKIVQMLLNNSELPIKPMGVEYFSLTDALALAVKMNRPEAARLLVPHIEIKHRKIKADDLESLRGALPYFLERLFRIHGADPELLTGTLYINQAYKYSLRRAKGVAVAFADCFKRNKIDVPDDIMNLILFQFAGEALPTTNQTIRLLNHELSRRAHGQSNASRLFGGG